MNRQQRRTKSKDGRTAGGGKATPISMRPRNATAFARTVAAITAVTGIRPIGWHTRSPGSAALRTWVQGLYSKSSD